MTERYYGIDQHTKLRREPLPGDLLVVTKTNHEAAIEQARADALKDATGAAVAYIADSIARGYCPTEKGAAKAVGNLGGDL